MVRKAAGLAGNLLRSTVNRDPDFMVTLYTSQIRTIIDYCSCIWNVDYLGDLHLLEGVQRRWTKQVDGLADLDYGARLHALRLFSGCGRLIRADMIKCWKTFHCLEDNVGLASVFSLAPVVGTRRHRFKLSVSIWHADLRRRFFSVRTVALWNSLLADVVKADSLDAFKKGLADCLGELLLD